jgi:Protein of unknown function (DUF3037)
MRQRPSVQRLSRAIQYVPDPIADERINVGVLVIDAEGITSRFVRTWDRVKSFGGADVAFLRDFARKVEAIGGPHPALPIDPNGITEDLLATAPGKWKNSIQITHPRASTLCGGDLLDEVARRFLRERVPQKRVRDRRAAAAIAAASLGQALLNEGLRKPEKYVHRNYEIEGRFEDHSFDVALANGALGLGVLAMSFESGNATQLRREVQATAWTIDDVLREHRDLPLAVVALPPRSRSKTYDHAVELFGELGADVVPEHEIEAWAEEAAEQADFRHTRTLGRRQPTAG